MMNLKYVFITFLFMALLLSGCAMPGQKEGYEDKTSEYGLTVETGSTQEEPVPSDETDEPAAVGEPADTVNPLKDRIEKMTLEEKIGQMIIVGFEGYEINNKIINMIESYHVGGFILFRGNIKTPDETLSLIHSIKSINSKNKAPLFISVDEEGGRISRMPAQLHKIPSNQAIGKINNREFSFKIGGLLAEEIKALGFNMNFAPVLDIFSNPKNTVIGDRAFGTDADTVSSLGVETMKGIRAGGVIPVVKHFPGHGDTLVDSHVGLPLVSHDMKRLESFELVPFKAAVDNQAEGVMVAHILMSGIDPENPASLSKIIITDILRQQMNFDGVVITDDMTMGAIEKNYKIGEAVVKSVEAGSDIILVCHGYDNQVKAIEALKEAVVNGVLSEERVNESIDRILRLKDKYGLTDAMTTAPVNIEDINKKIDTIIETYNVK